MFPPRDRARGGRRGRTAHSPPGRRDGAASCPRPGPRTRRSRRASVRRDRRGRQPHDAEDPGRGPERSGQVPVHHVCEQRQADDGPGGAAERPDSATGRRSQHRSGQARPGLARRGRRLFLRSCPAGSGRHGVIMRLAAPAAHRSPRGVRRLVRGPAAGAAHRAPHEPGGGGPDPGARRRARPQPLDRRLRPRGSLNDVVAG